MKRRQPRMLLMLRRIRQRMIARPTSAKGIRGLSQSIDLLLTTKREDKLKFRSSQIDIQTWSHQVKIKF